MRRKSDFEAFRKKKEVFKLKAVRIQRGWFEIDDCEDLKVVE